MTRPPFPVGNKLTPAEVADWVETCVIESGLTFKRGDLNSALNIEVDGDASLLEADSWLELQRRAVLFDGVGPVSFSGGRLVARNVTDELKLLYRYFCVLSTTQIDNSDRTLFEEIVLAILAPAFEGNAIRIGHPASQGLSKSFRDRVGVYIQSSNISDYEVGKPPIADDKDLGIDVVAWWPLPDGRGADLHYLIQCATGSDWVEKLSDIDLDVWARHIKWAVNPVRVFCLPQVVDVSPVKWVRYSTKAGLILDRPRLVGLARTIPPELAVRVRERLTDLAA